MGAEIEAIINYVGGVEETRWWRRLQGAYQPVQVIPFHGDNETQPLR